jgi:hypothetical protein
VEVLVARRGPLSGAASDANVGSAAPNAFPTSHSRPSASRSPTDRNTSATRASERAAFSGVTRKPRRISGSASRTATGASTRSSGGAPAAKQRVSADALPSRSPYAQRAFST